MCSLRMNISKAIAKFNFHKIVTEDDCILAIYIYNDYFKFKNPNGDLSNTNFQHLIRDNKDLVR
jgi:hypothetical protein